RVRSTTLVTKKERTPGNGKCGSATTVTRSGTCRLSGLGIRLRIQPLVQHPASAARARRAGTCSINCLRTKLLGRGSARLGLLFAERRPAAGIADGVWPPHVHTTRCFIATVAVYKRAICTGCWRYI